MDHATLPPDREPATRSSSAPEIDRGAEPREAGGRDRSVDRDAAASETAGTPPDETEGIVAPEAVEGGALEIEDLTTDPATPDSPDT